MGVSGGMNWGPKTKTKLLFGCILCCETCIPLGWVSNAGLVGCRQIGCLEIMDFRLSIMCMFCRLNYFRRDWLSTEMEDIFGRPSMSSRPWKVEAKWKHGIRRRFEIWAEEYSVLISLLDPWECHSSFTTATPVGVCGAAVTNRD